MKGRGAGAVRTRPQRLRIFVGCEGASEQGYAALLQSLFDERGLAIKLDIAILNPGAGDPHELVKRAAAMSGRAARQRGPHASRFVLLDHDRHDPDGALGRRTIDLAREQDIALIWQVPCHEALMLRHLPGCKDRRPSTTADAQTLLARHWPAYEKPMSRQSLRAKIDEDAVLQAASREPGLRSLLLAAGFLSQDDP